MFQMFDNYEDSYNNSESDTEVEQQPDYFQINYQVPYSEDRFNRIFENCIYKGEYQNNLFHGNGEITDKNGDYYVGEFKYGYAYGHVNIYYKNGDHYIGEVKYNKPHGKGKLYFNNGSSYEGDFERGKRDGCGKLKINNGNYYEGELYNNKFNGYGRFTYIDNFEISYKEGFWSDNILNGNATILRKNGTTYVGNVIDSLEHGYGIEFYENNKIKYTGNWKNGKYDGHGIFNNFLGSKIYCGFFKCGLRHGDGEEYVSNCKRIFYGKYKYGMRHGSGYELAKRKFIEFYYYKNKKWEDIEFKLESSIKEENCSICLGRLNKNMKVVKTSCNHVFHSKCLKKWIIDNQKCPLCRKNIEFINRKRKIDNI